MLARHKLVERIVSRRDVVPDTETWSSGVEYLVKWEGLMYEQCTWEKQELISKRYDGILGG